MRLSEAASLSPQGVPNRARGKSCHSGEVHSTLILQLHGPLRDGRVEGRRDGVQEGPAASVPFGVGSHEDGTPASQKHSPLTFPGVREHD